jgi:hypothetical protein
MRKDDKLIFCMPRKGDILGHAESTLWRKAAASPNCKASTSDEKAAWLHSVSHKCEHVGQSLFFADSALTCRAIAKPIHPLSNK